MAPSTIAARDDSIHALIPVPQKRDQSFGSVAVAVRTTDDQ